MSFVVGIGGGTGSGKTTLAGRLAAHYAALGAVLVDQDSYYHDFSHLSPGDRARTNFDEPAAVDFDRFVADLEHLVHGEPIMKPRYSFLEHRRKPEFDKIDPAPLVVVEGLFAFWDPRARALMGLTVYLGAAEEQRFARRLQRDLRGRGRTEASVREQFARTVRPMHRCYIEPMRSLADLVLDTTAIPLRASLPEILRVFERVFPASSPAS